MFFVWQSKKKQKKDKIYGICFENVSKYSGGTYGGSLASKRLEKVRVSKHTQATENKVNRYIFI